ncbi:MAG: hypothetical protein ACOX0Z_02080 [Candidatus Nanosyncoccaceae bacterium]|jgi:hypothetical protein
MSEKFTKVGFKSGETDYTTLEEADKSKRNEISKQTPEEFAEDQERIREFKEFSEMIVGATALALEYNHAREVEAA